MNNTLITLNTLKQTFDTGIVIFDQNYNIVCFNKTIEELFKNNGFDPEATSNLSQIHSQKTLTRIKRMIEKAHKNAKEGSHVIKLYRSHQQEQLIFIGKVFLLHGQCDNLFVAILYDVTNILTNEQNSIVKFPVYEGENFLLLNVEEIEYFKAVGNYTEVFCKQTNHLSPLSLGEIEKRLNSDQFIRCHKSFIVNLTYVKNLKKADNKYFIVTTNQKNIPISRNKTDLFLRCFGLR